MEQEQSKESLCGTLFYLDMWNNEEQQNEQAKVKSFEKSQQDEEVTREQYEQDIAEIDITKNPNCRKKLPIICRNDNKHRK